MRRKGMVSGRTTTGRQSCLTVKTRCAPRPGQQIAGTLVCPAPGDLDNYVMSVRSSELAAELSR